MTEPASGVKAELRLWPWSAPGAQAREVFSITGDEPLRFSFFGSPLIALAGDGKLFLPARHEQFIPHGTAFRSQYGEYRLYEAPHGILSSPSSLRGTRKASSIILHFGRIRRELHFIAQGAYEQTIDAQQSVLVKQVLAWSQLFDDWREKATRQTRRPGRLPWKDIRDYLRSLVEEGDEPRMALIVHIAREMSGQLSFIVRAARKILLRERLLMPAGRIAEMDTSCLRWYVRQPGQTMAQKAAANRQSLLGIARKESFNTLENKILKDFLFRCQIEAQRYLTREVESNPVFKITKKACEVRHFAALCTELHAEPHLCAVTSPPADIRPNYVLQNDERYRQVWINYLRLLRQEEEKDRSWDWQARTWADIVRLLVNACLCELAAVPSGLATKALLKSALGLRREQYLGCRIISGTEPGPFAVVGGGTQGWMIEVVHPDLAGQHHVTQGLGRLGGHLYLVLEHTRTHERRVIVIWAVHTAGSHIVPDWQTIGRSARHGLQHHEAVLRDMSVGLPRLSGLVVASDLKAEGVELYSSFEGLPVLQVPAEQRRWDGLLGDMAAILQGLLEEATA